MNEKEKLFLNGRGRLLQTSKEIMAEYDLTRRQFKRFLQMGMPARYMDGRWYAYTKNIDLFFEDFFSQRALKEVMDQDQEDK